MIEKYLNAPYKRVILNRYLDSRYDREGYKAGEEKYKKYKGKKKLKENNIILKENNAPIVDNFPIIPAYRPQTPIQKKTILIRFISPQTERIVPILSNNKIIARY